MSYYFPFATWQCHCWPLDQVQVSVRMLPVRLALCDLEAPGWGEPWFLHCAFVASWHRLLYGIFVVLLFRVCFPLPYQSLR